MVEPIIRQNEMYSVPHVAMLMEMTPVLMYHDLYSQFALYRSRMDRVIRLI